MITRPKAPTTAFIDLMRTSLTKLDSASPSERIEATMAFHEAKRNWASTPSLQTEINRQKLVLALCLLGNNLSEANETLDSTVNMYASAYGLYEVNA